MERGAIDADDIGLAHAREAPALIEELVRQHAGFDLAQFQRDLHVQQRIVSTPDFALRAAAKLFEHLQRAETEAVRYRRLRRDRAHLQMAETLGELLDLAQSADRPGSAGLEFAPVHWLFIGNAR